MGYSRFQSWLQDDEEEKKKSETNKSVAKQTESSNVGGFKGFVSFLEREDEPVKTPSQQATQENKQEILNEPPKEEEKKSIKDWVYGAINKAVSSAQDLLANKLGITPKRQDQMSEEELKKTQATEQRLTSNYTPEQTLTIGTEQLKENAKSEIKYLSGLEEKLKSFTGSNLDYLNKIKASGVEVTDANKLMDERDQAVKDIALSLKFFSKENISAEDIKNKTITQKEVDGMLAEIKRRKEEATANIRLNDEITGKEAVDTNVWNAVKEAYRNKDWWIDLLKTPKALEMKEDLVNAQKEIDAGKSFDELTSDQRYALIKASNQDWEQAIDRGFWAEAPQQLAGTLGLIGDVAITGGIGKAVGVASKLALALGSSATSKLGSTILGTREGAENQFSLVPVQDDKGEVTGFKMAQTTQGTGSYVKSGVNAVTNNSLQMYTEMVLGDLVEIPFTKAGELVKGSGLVKNILSSDFSKKLGENFVARSLSNVGKFFTKSPATKEFLKSAGVSGIAGEVAEEFVQDITDSIATGNEYEISDKYITDVVSAVALTTFVIGGGTTVVSNSVNKNFVKEVNANKQEYGIPETGELQLDGTIIDNASDLDITDQVVAGEYKEEVLVTDDSKQQIEAPKTVFENQLDTLRAKREAEQVTSSNKVVDKVKAGDFNIANFTEEEKVGVQQVTEELQTVMDLGARKKVVGAIDEATGERNISVEGIAFPDYIPEEFRSRVLLEKALDTIAKQDIAPEGTKLWQLQQIILEQGKGAELKPEAQAYLDSQKEDKSEAPKTVRVFLKSKFSNNSSYSEIPVIGEVSGTFYQGSNEGESRQFWTDNKEYASQFGKVKEKTGDFYQVENGNRVTNVFVPKPTEENKVDVINQIRKFPQEKKEVGKFVSFIKTEKGAVVGLDEKVYRIESKLKDGGKTKLLLVDPSGKEIWTTPESIEIVAGSEYDFNNQDAPDLPFRVAQNGTQMIDTEALANDETKKILHERLKDFSKHLFGDENVHIPSVLFTPEGKKAWGKYQNAWIEIAQSSPDVMEDTFYHEAIHKALDLFVTPAEKKNLLNQVIKIYGADTLKKRWDRKSSDEKFRIMSYQSNVANTFNTNKNRAENVGFGVEKFNKRLVKTNEIVPNYLQKISSEFDIQQDQMWGSVVQKVESVDGIQRRSVYFVEGVEDAVHALSLIDDTLSGMAGEMVGANNTKWHITAINDANLSDMNVIVEGKFDPTALDYSQEADVRARQREYRKQFGLTKDSAKYRGAGISGNLYAMAEEQFAEDYIKYAKNEKTFIGKIRNLFDWMKDKIKNVLTGEASINGFYRDLTSGKLLDESYRPDYLYGDKPKIIEQWRKSNEEVLPEELAVKDVAQYREEIEQEGDDKDFINETTSIKLPELLILAENVLGKEVEVKDKVLRSKLRNALGVFGSRTGEKESAYIRLKRSLFAPKTELVFDAGTGKEVEIQTETEEERIERVQLIEKVLGHEIGHMIDFFGGEDNLTMKRGNLLGRLANLKSYMEKGFRGYENKDVRKELKNLTMFWNPFDPTMNKKYTEYRYSAKELYAEALSVMLNKPELLQKIAPQFQQAFFEYLDRKVEARDALLDVWDSIKSERAIQERLDKSDENFLKAQQRRMTIQERDEERKRFKGWADVWDGIKTGLVSEYNPFVKKFKNHINKSGIVLSKKEEAEQVLGNMKYLGNKPRLFIDEVQREFLDPITEAGLNVDDIGKIMMLERDLGDRLDIANPQGLIYDYAKESYEELKKSFGVQKWLVVESKLKWLRDRNFQIVEDGYKKGIYSKEFFENIATVNKNTYTPFAVIEYIDKNFVSSGVRQAKGTVKGIENPLVTMLFKSVQTIKDAEVNVGKAYVVNELSVEYPDEVIEAKAIRGEDGKFISWKKDSRAEDLQLKLLTLLVDGKVKGYYIDRYIYHMFESKVNTEWELAGKVLYGFKLYNKMWKPFKTTLNPSFALASNSIRDTERTGTNLATILGKIDKNSSMGMKLIGYRTGFLKKWFQTFKESWSFVDNELSESTKEMVENYAIDFSKKYDPIDTKDDQIAFDPIKKKVYISESTRDISDWLQEKLKVVPIINKVIVPLYDFYLHTGAMLEVNTKIAGYKYLREKGVGASDSAFFTRKYFGTPDYRQGGTFTEVTNTVKPFSNVAIQAIKADLDLGLDPTTRSGWWFQKFVVSGIPKLVMLFLASLLEYEDEEGNKKKVYDLISEYTKTSKLVFPFGMNNGKVMTIEIPQDETSKLYGAILWKMFTYMQGKGMKIEQLASISSAFVPFVDGENPFMGLIKDWAEYSSGRNPYDEFRGRPVIGLAKWNEGGAVRLAEMFKWTLNEATMTWFDTYDDGTKTGFEKAFDLPVIERLFSITDYGVQEREEWEKSKGKEKSKQDRRKYMKDYLENPTTENLIAVQDRFIKSVYGDAPEGGWKGSDKQRVTTSKKDFKRFILENSGKDEYQGISKSGLNNEEKVGYLNTWSERMSKEGYAEYLGQLLRYEVVSPELFADTAEEKGLGSSSNYSIVRNAIPLLSEEQSDTLVRELRKKDLLNNDDLRRLKDDGLLTGKGFASYINVNKQTEAVKQKMRDVQQDKTKVYNFAQ